MHTFPIQNFWDGSVCTDTSLHALVHVQPATQGLEVSTELPRQKSPHNPEAPSQTRVANLWEYDVVELFLVGENSYLEIELGPQGHFLLLSFSEPRVRSNEYTDVALDINVETSDTHTKTTACIPWDVIPQKLHSYNAFVIVRDNFLAHQKTPGYEPDFHQPAIFPMLPEVLRNEIETTRTA